MKFLLGSRQLEAALTVTLCCHTVSSWHTAHTAKNQIKSNQIKASVHVLFLLPSYLIHYLTFIHLSGEFSLKLRRKHSLRLWFLIQTYLHKWSTFLAPVRAGHQCLPLYYTVSRNAKSRHQESCSSRASDHYMSFMQHLRESTVLCDVVLNRARPIDRRDDLICWL